MQFNSFHTNLKLIQTRSFQLNPTVAHSTNLGCVTAQQPFNSNCFVLQIRPSHHVMSRPFQDLTTASHVGYASGHFNCSIRENVLVWFITFHKNCYSRSGLKLVTRSFTLPLVKRSLVFHLTSGPIYLVQDKTKHHTSSCNIIWVSIKFHLGWRTVGLSHAIQCGTLR